MRFRGPVLDARDAVELAQFYATVLGWAVKDHANGDEGSWAIVESPSGELKMEFQGSDDYVAPAWPNVPGEQQMMMHVDIAVEVLGDDDARAKFAAVVEHAVSLGARVAEHQPRPEHFTVMFDPAGHPFCFFPTTAVP